MDQPARRVAYGSLNSECRCLKLVDTFRWQCSHPSILVSAWRIWAASTVTTSIPGLASSSLPSKPAWRAQTSPAVPNSRLSPTDERAVCHGICLRMRETSLSMLLREIWTPFRLDCMLINYDSSTCGAAALVIDGWSHGLSALNSRARAMMANSEFVVLFNFISYRPPRLMSIRPPIV